MTVSPSPAARPEEAVDALANADAEVARETAEAPREAPSRATPDTGDRVTRAWNVAAVTLPTLAVAALGWRDRALTDDGTIFLRTVRQILAGNGPVVNTGERVEANTSTLWQWLLVLIGAVTPGDIGFAAVVTGLLLTAAGVALGLDATRRLLLHGRARRVVPAGVLVLVGLPVYWEFATAGLDTGLGTCWLGGSWWLLVRSYLRPGARWQAWHAVWFGLGFLVRPDFAVIGAVFLVGLWLLLRPSPWRTAGYAAAAAALPLAYEIFRAGYYGLLVPLPALTKEAGEDNADRGLRYVWDLVDPVALYVPAALFVVLLVAWAVPRVRGDRRRLAVVLTPVAAALVSAAYVIRVGGDYMQGRMLLPALFLMLLPGFLLPATPRLGAVAAATAVWAVAVAGPWNDGAHQVANPDLTARVRISDIEITGSRNADRTSRWTIAFPGLKAAVDAGLAADRPVLVRLDPAGGPPLLLPLAPVHGGSRISFPGGYLGVAGALVPLDGYIIEFWGLANTVGAHMEPAPGHLWPGHRKPLDEVWLLALELDPSVTYVPEMPGVTAEALAAARRALACGDLKELLASVREPMSLSRFVDNLTGAYDRTKFRIPRDPFAAERKFC
ncbi:ArnT family glycosyltransferase [Streptodolium elevatio]